MIATPRRPAVRSSLQLWSAALDLSRISRSFAVRVHDRNAADYLSHEAVANLTLRAGRLWIDGREVADPVFGRDFVRFAHKTAHEYVSGALSFTPDGHAFTGTLFLGPTEHGAVRHDVAGVTPPTHYSTEIAASGAVPGPHQQFPAWSPEEPADPDQWSPGLDLVIGYEFAGTGSLPTPIYQLCDPQDPDRYLDLDGCAPSVDEQNQNFMLTLSVGDPGMTSVAVDEMGPLFPAAFTVEFAWDGGSFRGTFQHFDTASDQAETAQHAWRGTARTSAPDPGTSDVTSLAATALANTAGDPQPQDLSIAELFTLQPDPKTLQDTQFAMLLENTKWALANNSGTQDWVATYFGQVPPNLSAARIAEITTDKSFYTDRFAISYLGKSLNEISGPAAPETKLTAGQELDLEFYLRAGLAAHPGYTRQSQGVFLRSFTQTTPRLDKYLQTQATEDWATQLYHQLLTPVQMNMTINKIIAGQGLAEANRHSTVLQALQPSSDLARQYHERITTATMSRTVSHLNLDDSDAVRSWLSDTIAAFITAFLHDNLDIPGTDVAAQAAMVEAAREMEKAVAAADGVAKLAAALADLTVAAGGKDVWEKLANAKTLWGKAGYGFANMIYFLSIAGSTFMAASAFARWDTLKDTQKASAVVTAIEVAAKIVKNVPEIVSAGKVGYTEIGKFFQESGSSDVGETFVNMMVKFGGDDVFSYGAQGLGEIADTASREMAVENTSWVKAFNNTVGKACEVIGVAAAVAYAVLSTIDFVNEVNGDAPVSTKALDGIIMAANIGVAVCAVAALALGGVVIPVIGAVFAVIGIVATLIEMFDPPSPPPSPAEVFMTDHLLPAFSGPNRWVLAASDGWTPDEPVPTDNPYSPPTTSLAPAPAGA
ncbi:hypothetical protein [Micromonospora sp. 4G55]|uniref:hypothetical protein n=1 Tax=Micromonospora sp. 4G55 TaxID=2806102 RepID=UPI001A421132|nr:hypothetical protein [Micromonospora sp. 4G55]MBM0255470.1 hypothetical protein [Micromonospora sp. 4G55]